MDPAPFFIFNSKLERFEIGESNGTADGSGCTRIHKIIIAHIYVREDSAKLRVPQQVKPSLFMHTAENMAFQNKPYEITDLLDKVSAVPDADNQAFFAEG
jgi:hypothetical protein